MLKGRHGANQEPFRYQRPYSFGKRQARLPWSACVVGRPTSPSCCFPNNPALGYCIAGSETASLWTLGWNLMLHGCKSIHFNGLILHLHW